MEKGEIEFSVNESHCDGRSEVDPLFPAEKACGCVFVGGGGGHREDHWGLLDPAVVLIADGQN